MKLAAKFKPLDRPIVHVILIALLGLLAYSNTFDVPFQFDDIIFTENPRTKNISDIFSLFTGLKGYWASRPLLHATLEMNYHLGGFNTRGYHAVNLSLHLLNGVLLYLLIVITGRHMGYSERDRRLAGFFASLLFTVHPMQTEAVTYIISRSVLFATMFYFLGILFFLMYVTVGKRKGLYIMGLSIVSFLGMASREDFATFPLMLLLYDLFFISRFRLKAVAGHWKAYLPVLLSLGYLAHLVLNNTYGKLSNFPDGMPPAKYALTQFNVHWTYLRLLLLPINQSIDHDYPAAKTLLEAPALFSSMGYVALWAMGVMLSRRRPLVSFSIFWFLIALFPVSFAIAFLNLRLSDVIFEHRAYLPATGVFIALAIAVTYLITTLKSEKARVASIIMVALVPLALASATYARNSVWRSETSLWEDVIQKSPGKWRGYYNLGNISRAMGEVDKAIGLYTTAIKLKPDNSMPHNNLGICYKMKGDFEKAEEQYLIALLLDPDDHRTYNNLGNIYLSRNSYDAAEKYFQNALLLQPDYIDAHYNMGILYYMRGSIEQAVEHYKKALSLKPDHADAHLNLGVAYLIKGSTDMARAEFEKVLLINPNDERALQYLNNLRDLPHPGGVK